MDVAFNVNVSIFEPISMEPLSYVAVNKILSIGSISPSPTPPLGLEPPAKTLYATGSDFTPLAHNLR